MNTLSRKDAIKQNLSYYFTGKPCPSGHVCLRKVHNSTCYICAQSARTTRQSTIRLLAIQKLGGACKHCGFSDIRALQIDHINGGGVKERKELGSEGACKLVISGQDNNMYQLLCANCNWIKRAERNEHRISNYDRRKIQEVQNLLGWSVLK